MLLLILLIGQLCSQGLGFRLPSDLVPLHYDLSLVFNVDRPQGFPFFGVVKIDVMAVKPTTLIILHAKSFTIPDKAVTLTDFNTSLVVRSVKMSTKYDFLTITAGQQLKKGVNYTLTIPFRGNLQLGLNGVYISSYYDVLNKQREYLVTTQFEPTSARRGFPCFDEPLLKATFRINIGHQRNFTVISNMPLDGSSDDNYMEKYWPWETINQKFKSNKSNYVWDQFGISPRMSTYLVAFVVSKFPNASPETNQSMFRVWSRRDAIGQTHYATDIGPRLLTYFDSWLEIPYSLPKMDLVAIPDFRQGGMENWGLVTFAEGKLLLEDRRPSLLEKQSIASLISHELAHQWFGNLVTMSWWSDVWLKEGMATYLGTVALNALEPSWQMNLTDTPERMASVLTKDALEHSHPVSVPIEDPGRVVQIFDEISYSKASLIFRMMSMFLGEKVFLQALNNYLTKHAYGNAEKDDLWRELTAAARQTRALGDDVTVQEIMATWTNQPGYPLLNVSRIYADLSRSGQESLTITQKRYYSASPKNPKPSAWWVPLALLTAPATRAGRAGRGPLLWLTANQGTAKPHEFQHGAGDDSWIILNDGMLAPCRVNYDARNWQLLSEALRGAHSSVPVLSRTQLVVDAFEFAWHGIVDYSTTLELAGYLSRETEYPPLNEGFSALYQIGRLLSRSPDYGIFQEYARTLVEPAYKRAGGLQGHKGNLVMKSKMQLLAVRWACVLEVAGCEQAAVDLFQAWMDSPAPDDACPIPASLLYPVCCAAVRRGGSDHFQFLLRCNWRTNVAVASRQYQEALACTRDPWLINQYLEMALLDIMIRKQDGPWVVSYVAKSAPGYLLAKEFLYTRIDEIHAAFRDHEHGLPVIIGAVLEQVTEQRELDQFLEWQKKQSKYLAQLKEPIAQAVEAARINIEWVDRHKRNVVNLMDGYTKPKETRTSEDKGTQIRAKDMKTVARASTSRTTVSVRPRRKRRRRR